MNEGKDDQEVIEDELNKTEIEMQESPKNKHRKILKVKAYCGECYQFFHNGPHSKICKDHLKKKCNLVKCQKGSDGCVRKFPNTNSANRHTHCLKKEEVEKWNANCEIRKCLGEKREISIEETNNHFTTNNIIGLIDKIGHVNFNENDFEYNNLFNLTLNYEPQKNSPSEEEDKNCKTEEKINDNDSIENFFEIIQRQTNISNSTKKKIIKAFKNKGILNVRVLKLFYEKRNDWEILIEQFKAITPQIEGVSLYIDNLLGTK